MANRGASAPPANVSWQRRCRGLVKYTRQESLAEACADAALAAAAGTGAAGAAGACAGGVRASSETGAWSVGALVFAGVSGSGEGAGVAAAAAAAAGGGVGTLAGGFVPAAPGYPETASSGTATLRFLASKTSGALGSSFAAPDCDCAAFSANLALTAWRSCLTEGCSSNGATCASLKAHQDVLNAEMAASDHMSRLKKSATI